MYENLMYLVPILLDVGNIIYFIVNFEQVINAFKNRKDLGKGLGSRLLIGLAIGSAVFAVVGLITGAPFTVFSNITMITMFFTQLYWKRKYRKK